MGVSSVMFGGDTKSLRIGSLWRWGRRWLRRLLWGWLSFGVLVLVVWFGVYIWLGGRLDGILSDVIGRAEYAGHRVVYRGLSRGGFPVSIRRIYRGVEVYFANGLYFESPVLSAEYFMIDPRRAELRGEGIVLRSFGGGGDFGDFELGLEDGLLLLRRELTGAARGVSLRGGGVRFSRPGGLGVSFRSVAADLDVAEEGSEHTLDFLFSFAGGEGLGLGGDGVLDNSAWRSDFLLRGRFFGEVLGVYDRYGVLFWRDSGGYIEMDTLRFASGAATIEAMGSLALDAEARPLGSGRFLFSGGEALLEELGMSQEAAAALSGGGGGVSGDGDGDLLRMDLSWRIQEGTLFVEGFPVYEFEPLF
ncbi:MAG: DUF2125 domain-containing protein [Alphaproteobacteria bacterium]